MKDLEILGLGLLVLVLLSRRQPTPMPARTQQNGIDPNVVIRTAGQVVDSFINWASSSSETSSETGYYNQGEFVGPPAPTSEDGETWYA